MLIRRRSWALMIGYDIGTDLPYGLVLGIGERPQGRGYRFIVNWHFGLPTAVYALEEWALNETGYLRGLPIARAGIKSSAWTGRDRWIVSWRWPHHFKVTRHG